MMKALTVGPVLILANYAAAFSTYTISKEYSGSTFFDGWNFYDHYDDKMNGDVNFVSASVGASSKLAYVDPSTNRAIIKVDNTTQVPWNEKRNSVRITTEESFGLGSVWIADIYHAPYGCSVWPSWWSYAAKANWPAGGEIDVFEGINRATSSQMGLHTEPGCEQKNPTQISTLINSTNCAGENNAGCIITNTDPASYGPAFAAAQGGVFITEFVESGISVWFFSRDKIPQSVTPTSKTIDTSTLGTPMGNWPASGCNITEFFEPQNLVFTITLCGDFARPPQIFQQTCSGICYDDYVIKDPSNYDTAYFDIASVRVFRDNRLADGGGDTGPSGGSGNSSNNNNGGSSGSPLTISMPALWSIPVMAAVVGLVELIL